MVLATQFQTLSGDNVFNNEMLKKVYKGTTTVGIVGKDFVILGADKRVSSGTYIFHKQGKKIHAIDHHVATTMAGVVADAQSLVEQLRIEAAFYRLTNERPMPVQAVATLASILLFQMRPILIAHMLIGGVDGRGAQLYSIDWLGTVTQEKYTASGSGSPYAVTLLENEYSENISKEEAIRLAIKAVNAAMRRDPGSGEGIDGAVIDKNGVKELNKHEITEILKMRVS